MQETQMDAATQREDMNDLSSVANIRQKQEAAEPSLTSSSVGVQEGQGP